MGASGAAAEYERRFPGALDDPVQKQERMERLAHREERQQLRRTNKTRGIVVPPLPLDENGRLKP